MKGIERYISVFQTAEAELSFKKSRFIACLLPAESESNFQEQLNHVKNRYPKATHYCYAVIYGVKNRWEKMSDDGEPSGTAGRPILDVLRGSGIINAMLVVVRYFGGTLLGTGGLVRAYSETAQEVIKKAGKVCMCPATHFKVCLDYSYYNQFESKCRMKLIGDTNIEFLEQVEISMYLPLEEKEKILILLQEITMRTAQIQELDNVYVPIPI